MDEFFKLYREDKDILGNLAETKTKALMFLSLAKRFGFDPENKLTKEYQKFADSEDPKDKEKLYKDFIKFVALSPELQKKYFDRLKKEGFNSIYDDNDILAGYSEKPLIVFDPNITLNIRGKEAVDERAADRSFEELEKLERH